MHPSILSSQLTIHSSFCLSIHSSIHLCPSNQSSILPSIRPSSLIVRCIYCIHYFTQHRVHSCQKQENKYIFKSQTCHVYYLIGPEDTYFIIAQNGKAICSPGVGIMSLKYVLTKLTLRSLFTLQLSHVAFPWGHQRGLFTILYTPGR